MDFIETCRKFIAIDSSPSQGTRAIAEFAALLGREAGFCVELQGETQHDLDQANVIIRPCEQKGENELLLQTHLDTIDPGNYSLWTETGANPFNASIYQNRMYGLGTANVKLDFLCKLEALKKIPKNTTFKKPWVLVGTYGEELGMSGALRLIRKNKVSANQALIGEPTNLQLVTKGKGYAVVEIQIPFSEHEQAYRLDHNLRESTSTQSKMFSGKAAHSATPDLGESAILKMLEYMEQLPEGLAIMEIEGGVTFNSIPSHAVLEVDLVAGLKESMTQKVRAIYGGVKNLQAKFLDYQDSSFNPPHPTLNIGRIETHENHVSLLGSCRIHPMVTNEIYESWMQGLRKTCEQNGAQFRITDYKRPFESSENSEFVKLVKNELLNLSLDDACGSQASTNEASLFSRTGIECVSFGPGRREGNAHSSHEYVEIDDLRKAIQFYQNVVQRWSL